MNSPRNRPNVHLFDSFELLEFIILMFVLQNQLNGNASKEEVFRQINNALTELIEQKKAILSSVAA